MLLRRNPRNGLAFLGNESQPLSIAQDRQLSLVLVLDVLVGLGSLRSLRVLGFLIDRRVAGELDDRPGRAEEILVLGSLGNAVHAGDFQHRGDHLGGNEPVPDQLVQLVVITVEVLLDRCRIPMRGRRTNRLVGLLRGLLVLVHISRTGKVVVAETLANNLPGFLGRLIGDTRGVCAHVGDQSDRPFFADFHALVELLREHHGFLRAETQLARRVLLQAAGDERGNRVAPLLLALDGLDHKVFALDVLDDPGRFRFGRKHRLLAVHAVQLRIERRRLCPGEGRCN